MNLTLGFDSMFFNTCGPTDLETRISYIQHTRHHVTQIDLFCVVPQPIAWIHTIQLFTLLAQNFLKKKLTCYMLSPSPIDWFFLFEEAWNMGHSERFKYRPKKLTFSFQVPTLEIKMFFWLGGVGVSSFVWCGEWTFHLAFPSSSQVPQRGTNSTWLLSLWQMLSPFLGGPKGRNSILPK